MVDKQPEKIARMFDSIAPRYDFLNRVISAGQDMRWRKHLIGELPPGEGGTLCDVACGTGDLLALARERRTDFADFLGIDISPGMLAVARKRLHENNSTRTRLVEASALALPVANASVASLTIAFGIRNIEPRAQALAEFHRVLRPGGALAILEIVSPEKGLLGSLFHFYFHKLMPKAAALFSSESAYRYLPESVAGMPTATDFCAEICASGFELVREKRWVFGAVGCFVFQKKG